MATSRKTHPCHTRSYSKSSFCVNPNTPRGHCVCLPTHAAPTLLCLRQHKRYTGRHLREVRFCNGCEEDLARVLESCKATTPLCTNQASALTTRAASARDRAALGSLQLRPHAAHPPATGQKHTFTRPQTPPAHAPKPPQTDAPNQCAHHPGYPPPAPPHTPIFISLPPLALEPHAVSKSPVVLPPPTLAALFKQFLVLFCPRGINGR